MIVTGVRHFGVESIEAGGALRRPMRHPLVTGFGMAGDERMRRFRGLCPRLRDRPRGRARHHRACRRTDRLGERRGSARPHPPVAHRPWRARHRESRPRHAHRRRGRRAGMLPGLEYRAEGLRQLRRPSFSGAQGGRLQGDAQLRRPALFLDLAEARIRYRRRAFRHERQGADGGHQDGDRGGFCRQEDEDGASRAAQRRRADSSPISDKNCGRRDGKRFLAGSIAARVARAAGIPGAAPCRASPSSTIRLSSTS